MVWEVRLAVVRGVRALVVPTPDDREVPGVLELARELDPLLAVLRDVAGALAELESRPSAMAGITS